MRLQLALLLLLGCGSDDPAPGEEDLGRLDDVLDGIAKTLWPGVDVDGVRTVRLLNGFFAGEPSAYWFAGPASRVPSDVFVFCREGAADCPFVGDRLNRDAMVGAPVFRTIPGEEDYSPFWRLWTVSVPADYRPDELKSVFGIEQAELDGRLSVERTIVDHGGAVGPDEALLHCLLVLDGTELEGNGADVVGRPGVPSAVVERRVGWHKQYRVSFFDFSDSEGVFAPDPTSASVPVMPWGDEYILYRDCAGGSTAATCGAQSLERGAITERGVELDLTGDGDRADTNNVISGFPGIDNDDELDRPYSALWRILRVLVRADRESELVLVEDSGDQSVSDVRDPQTIRSLVADGVLVEPEEMREAEVGLQVPGNEGVLFFDCPSQVPAE